MILLNIKLGYCYSCKKQLLFEAKMHGVGFCPHCKCTQFLLIIPRTGCFKKYYYTMPNFPKY